MDLDLNERPYAPSALQPFASLRKIAVIWMIVAPILVLMAALSRVDSALYFGFQFVFFTAVFAGAYVFGIAVFCGARWAAPGLACISCLAMLFFFGHALYGLLYTVGHPSQNLGFSIFAVLFFVAAGLPFAAAARFLLRARSH